MVRLKARVIIATLTILCFGVAASPAQQSTVGVRMDGKRLFEREIFGGNGRTCLTCHSLETGTVSPADALKRFEANPRDPLFLHDGSDDGQGNGVSRILKDATILIEIPLPPNVTLKDDPTARTVTLRRGIPTTLNTPALDPVLMLDGRAPTLSAQAADAIRGHAQVTQTPDSRDLQRIAEFQVTDGFFSSRTLRDFFHGGAYPVLPEGTTESEKRGRVFFEEVPFNPLNPKAGACAFCHSGPLLNEMSRFAPPPFRNERFSTVFVSELNRLGNPVHTYVFTDGNKTMEVTTPDPGRALITGRLDGVDPIFGPLFNSVNAFKIPILRGLTKTAPYFHDNSAQTLEDVAAHYAFFFKLLGLDFTPQDQEDMVAFMKLLD